MRKIKKTISILLSVIFVFMSMGIASSAAVIGDSGTFSMISYNIQGMPVPSSMTDSGRDALLDNTEIANILNSAGFDIVAVQEDLNYDFFFRGLMTNYKNITNEDGVVTERHATDHAGGAPSGDGLNIFSVYPLYSTARQMWNVSSGAYPQGDKLIQKGFQVATIQLEDGYYLDIYNINADAYGDPLEDTESIAARQSQFAQLAQYIMKRSVYDETTGTYDHAVIVTGDFNSSLFRQDSTAWNDGFLSNLLEAAHLNDAWAVSTIDSITENPEDYSAYYIYASETDAFDGYWGHYDSVERVCYANGNGIDLSCLSFKYNDYKGTDSNASLSGHYAVETEFSYEIVEKVQDINHNHDDPTTDPDENFLIKFLNYIASIFKAIGAFLQDYKNWFTGV